MPNKDAAVKSLRQSKVRAERNRKVLSDIDAVIRKTRKAIVAKDLAKAKEWMLQAVKRLDKAAQSGLVKKNTAARKKSRLAAALRTSKA